MANPNLLYFNSNIQIDKVLMVQSGTINIAAPVSPQLSLDGSFSFNTGVGDYAFFYGIYSLDNGATWNDFNAATVEYVSGNPVFNTCDVWGQSTVGVMTVYARNWYIFGAASQKARTVMFKVAIIAKPDQGVVGDTSTDKPLQFSSRYNYQKILIDYVSDITLASNERRTITIPHGLGYPPKMRGWAVESSVLYDFGKYLYGDAYSAFYSDSTNVTLIISNENNPSARSLRVYVRVYYDA